ncbi:MAG: hypothetical protein OXP28_10630 [Gammaproteobacteria bacterium]|nr:hypothetical protein [Gammaproteobacteria bacterium]MDE0225580.1 hypothetical protein [Gammaproteobacteria bacterium]
MIDIRGEEPPLAGEFRHFMERRDGVVDGALLVSRLVDPDTDAGWCRSEMRRLAEVAGADAGPVALVESLHSQGFRGVAPRRYYLSRHSALEHVLRHREGIPISLGVVILGAAAHLDLRATGIDFPRRFLVALNNRLVDPTAMRMTSKQDCLKWLRRELRNDGRRGVVDDTAFRPSEPSDIVLRMLNNLRLAANLQGDHARALDLTDYQIILHPTAFSLHVDRADLWLSLGSLDMARRELERAMELAHGKMQKRIRKRLDALPSRGSAAN